MISQVLRERADAKPPALKTTGKLRWATKICKERNRYMNVLHVYRTYFPDPPGGLQEVIRQLCLATRARGVENTIFTLSPRPDPRRITRPEAQIVRCRSWAAPASCDLGGIEAFREFRELAKQADLINYHFPWPFADVLHGWVNPTTPAVLSYHSDIVRQKWLGRCYSGLMWKTLRSMSAIVASSPTYAKTSPILSDSSLQEKLRVIPYGIDMSSYRQDAGDAIPGRLGIAEDTPFFLFIGVLRYYKGLHTLVDAAGRVGAKVVIAGSGSSLADLQAQADRIGATNVIFANQISDSEKVALLKRCTALLLPSHLRSEAFGMVLAEAAMFGRPLISCEIGTGTTFVNIEGETGCVVPPEDPEALAAAMNRLLHDSELNARYGAGARRRYEEKFSATAFGEAYCKLYQEVVGQHAARFETRSSRGCAT